MTVFNSESNNLDLYSDCLWLCGLLSSDTTSYPIKDFTRNANFALDIVTGKIIKAKNWEHDDTNNSSTEILDVTVALVSGTKKYAIPVTWLKIGSPVRVKDSAGNWNTIVHKDRNELTDAQLVATGVPTSYDKRGNWIYLSPTPNYAATGGLEVPFQRGASYFVYTDTTKTPGFATPFHRLIALYAALDYCEANNLDKRAKGIKKKIEEMETDLVLHYEARDDDEQPSIRLQKEDYGEAELGGNSGSRPNGF
jgi:hypothetical protein